MTGPRLIIGGDSTIGNALISEWRSAGVEAFTTTRRRNTRSGRDDSAIHFDLAADEDPWQSRWASGVAVLCAGVTSLGDCRRDPETTRFINVERIFKLASRLVSQHGVHVIFLSTNLVFDGSRKSCTADHERFALTEYGRQKAEVEARLQSLQDVAIVRLTKVLHPNLPLLVSWRESLLAGRSIAAHVDQQLAPITLDTVVEGLTRIAEGRRTGVWQFSGPEDISYWTFAHLIAHRMDRPADLVVESRSSDSPDFEHNPQHTTLDSTGAQTVLRLHFASPLEVVDQLLD